MIRFKKEYEDAVIEIPSKRMKITKFNISDPHVQDVLKKFPKYAHNFEEVKDSEGNTSLQETSMMEGEGVVEPPKITKPAAKAKSKSTAGKGKGKK